jgi:hypothetical protein
MVGVIEISDCTRPASLLEEKSWRASAFTVPSMPM